jgi:hypothetical protein
MRTNSDDNSKLQAVPVSIGLGTLDVSFNLPVPLYRSFEDAEPFDILSFEQAKDGKLLFSTKRLKSALQPYAISSGDSDTEARANINHGLIRFMPQLTFRALEENEKFYRVVVNEKSFETAVIRKDPDFALLPQRDLFGVVIPKNSKGFYIYETWEHLLLRADFVYFSDDFSVYDKINGNVVFHSAKYKFLPYNVVEVNGNWAKVIYGRGREFNFEKIQYDVIEINENWAKDGSKRDAEGWVKWRDDKRILINIIEYTVD